MNAAVEVSPEEEEAWLEKHADRYHLVVLTEPAVPASVQLGGGRIIAIGSPDEPRVTFPIWRDEEFEDDLPPFRD